MFNKIKNFLVEKLFGKIVRHYKYRQRVKELRKRDPFIYK